jgi:hypothetical protein
MAYIMPEDSFVVEEIPELKFLGFEGDESKSTYAEIEELPCQEDNGPKWEFEPINIKIHFDKCALSYKFTIDIPFEIKNIIFDNVRDVKFYINDKEYNLEDGIRLKEGDEVKFKKMIRFKTFEESNVVLEGINYENPIKK